MNFTAETQLKQVWQVPEPPPIPAPLPTTSPMMTAGSLQPQGKFLTYIYLFLTNHMIL